jgi:hypothetical protein
MEQEANRIGVELAARDSFDPHAAIQDGARTNDFCLVSLACAEQQGFYETILCLFGSIRGGVRPGGCAIAFRERKIHRETKGDCRGCLVGTHVQLRLRFRERGRGLPPARPRSASQVCRARPEK